MARLNITFGNLSDLNVAKPASVAGGVKYTANTITLASLAAGSNNSNVIKVVHTEPVEDATLENLMAWVEANIDDYTNQLYEVYIPSIKTSDTSLSPTGKATTVYSFRGVKQSDHSLIATATVTANGTDNYPVGTVLECIIKPDFTRTLWRVTNSVQGIIEVATTTSVASRDTLMAAADTRAGGRENYTIIFDAVTFTAAGESPTHSTTDIFWCEVIKTDDRAFIRTSAAINAGGTYFNRVYYTRYDVETEVWSTWTPYNFQIMAIDQFTSSGVPDVYMQAMLNGYMMFTKGGMLYRLVKYDSTNNKAWFITDSNDRVKLVKSTSTGMWAITALGRFNIINFASTNGTLSEDNVAYLDVARTFTLEEDLAVLHHYQTSTTSTTREYNLMGVTYNGSTKYWIDVDTNTGAYTVTTQSISSGGGGIEFYDLTESVFITAANKEDTYTNFITLSSTDVNKIRNGIRFIPSTTTHANTIVPFMAALNITNSSTTNIYPRGCTSIAIYYNGDNMNTYKKLFILDLTNSKLWCYNNLFNYTTTSSSSNPTIKAIAYSLLNRRPDRVFIAADDVNYVPWKFEYRTTDASDVSKKHFYYSARKADGTLIYLHIMFNTSSAGSASIERLTSLPTS